MAAQIPFGTLFAMTDRINQLRNWLCLLGIDPESLTPASADASFRRYWRVRLGPESTGIVMDAPPDREPLGPWCAVHEALAAAGLPVPAVEAANWEQGFLLITDFGNETLLAHLTAAPEEAHDLYAEALAILLIQQRMERFAALPDYDRARLAQELALFPEWYITRHLGATLSKAEEEALQSTFNLLIDRALGQPMALVHRDYHSRNLMVLPKGHSLYSNSRLGVLDFQDAVWGPLTYDLVSLMRDAYIDWPEEMTLDLLIRYWQQARRFGLPLPSQFDQWYADYEWMGVQRHLKVLGIFARLAYRDGKTGYLAELPRVRRYLWKVVQRYAALRPLLKLFMRLHPEEVETGFTF